MPWDLNIATIDGATLPVSIPQHELHKNCHNDFAFKRCKTNHSSVCSEKVELGSNFNHGNPSCSHSSSFITLPHKRNSHDVSAFPAQISCAVVVQRLHGQRAVLSGILFSQDDKNSDTICLVRPKKVLLEFDSESFFKYKVGACLVLFYLRRFVLDLFTTLVPSSEKVSHVPVNVGSSFCILVVTI